MTIGIMGAMPEEIVELKNFIDVHEEVEMANFTIFKGSVRDKNVYFVQSGVGKVHAAMCAQLLISEFGIQTLIFTGVAGGINPDLNIGDVLLSIDAIQHDVDATALGTEPGEILFSNGMKIFSADQKLLELAENMKSPPAQVRKGRVLTGDQFIANKEKLMHLADTFAGDCVDMEGASVGQVCHIHNIPFLLIRSISDKADEEANVDFPQFMKDAAKNSASIVKHVLDSSIS